MFTYINIPYFMYHEIFAKTRTLNTYTNIIPSYFDVCMFVCMYQYLLTRALLILI